MQTCGGITLGEFMKNCENVSRINIRFDNDETVTKHQLSRTLQSLVQQKDVNINIVGFKNDVKNDFLSYLTFDDLVERDVIYIPSRVILGDSLFIKKLIDGPCLVIAPYLLDQVDQLYYPYIPKKEREVSDKHEHTVYHWDWDEEVRTVTEPICYYQT